MATQDFDFAALPTEDAEVPAIQRERAKKDNPFIDRMIHSWDNETGVKFEVPSKHVQRAVYLIRRAADDIECGVRVVLLDNHGTEIKAVKETRVKDGKEKEVTVNAATVASRKQKPITVLFQAKERRAARNGDDDDSEDYTEDGEE